MESLVGYNINDHRLRYKVLQSIHGLRRAGRVNIIYRPYVALRLFSGPPQTSIHSDTPKRQIGEGW